MLLKSDRLTQVAGHVCTNVPMADIGSDHARLPCYLVRERLVPHAIAIEVNRGPYERARRSVHKWGLSDRMEVRLADGLKGLTPGEVATIVIAGMGGGLIEHILAADQTILAQTKRLVLQPNVAAGRLRQWLLENGWELIAEELVFENDHFYDILVAERGTPHRPYIIASDRFSEERLLETGPLLWKQKHPLLRLRLEREINKWEGILRQMEPSQNKEKNDRRREMERQLQDWKEMSACLPKVNT